MNFLFTSLLSLLTFLLVTPTATAFGPYEARDFEYYVSQSPKRVSYSSFQFYDGTSKICTVCKYATRSYDSSYGSASPLPTEYVECENKNVKWKYQKDGQIIYVEFGYYQPSSNYNNEPDYVRIQANGTVIPTGCAPSGYYGYKCTPRETRYLTDFVAVI
ncbi:hypothetical protein Dda_1577 [Drechslerella dactyloides]|uniref:Secreted protein n=1 Tax=Drechslerella dactyloides TaxID=74499 RepID=A0AAD6NLJ2_DREDA|nr:hypothetical protein Dda_1577 [Drechslerella dactyloides]